METQPRNTDGTLLKRPRRELTPEDLERAKIVQESQSFGALYTTLASFGAVATSEGEEHTAEEWRAKIEDVRNGKASILSVTNTYKIRDTVERFLATDPIYQHYLLSRKK